jgi:hypothetical protein
MSLLLMPKSQMTNFRGVTSILTKKRNIALCPSGHRDNRTEAAENFGHRVPSCLNTSEKLVGERVSHGTRAIHAQPPAVIVLSYGDRAA